METAGNLLVLQCGEATPVCNSALAGAINEALNHESIEEIYGGLGGYSALLNEDFIDLASESQQAVRALAFTPGAVLGSMSTSLSKEQDLERAVQVLEAHNIRFLLVIGDEHALEASHQLSQFVRGKNYDLKVVVVPQSCYNEIPVTDHSLGFGSAVKHLTTVVREVSECFSAPRSGKRVVVIEVDNWRSGWLAAGATLAKERNQPTSAPNLIYLPEAGFSLDQFNADVQSVLESSDCCIAVVSRGLVDQNGNYLIPQTASDPMQTTSIGEFLSSALKGQGLHTEFVALGRSTHFSSHTISHADSAEASMAAAAAIKGLIGGADDKMVVVTRGDSEPYHAETSLVPLDEVMNAQKAFPEQWINEDQISISYQFNKYMNALIQGEHTVAYEHGVPQFAKMQMELVEKKLESSAV